jgi:hypothetical protein
MLLHWLGGTAIGLFLAMPALFTTNPWKLALTHGARYAAPAGLMLLGWVAMLWVTKYKWQMAYPALLLLGYGLLCASFDPHGGFRTERPVTLRPTPFPDAARLAAQLDEATRVPVEGLRNMVEVGGKFPDARGDYLASWLYAAAYAEGATNPFRLRGESELSGHLLLVALLNDPSLVRDGMLRMLPDDRVERFAAGPAREGRSRCTFEYVLGADRELRVRLVIEAVETEDGWNVGALRPDDAGPRLVRLPSGLWKPD